MGIFFLQLNSDLFAVVLFLWLQVAQYEGPHPSADAAGESRSCWPFDLS